MIHTTKILCSTIRYFSRDDQKLKTTFYRLNEIELKNVNIISDSFKFQLITGDLNLDNPIDISLYGA